MKLRNKQMVEEAMVRIEAIREHIKAHNAALFCISQYRRGEHVEQGDILGKLIEIELNEWRNLFMWALTLEPAEQDRIKAAAHARFLADGMHVANWLNDGVSPSIWLESEEQEFREMARNHFAPKAE